MTADLPLPENAITERMGRLKMLALQTDVSEACLLMVQQLHIAVHGDTWARPESPSRVWEQLLAEVSALREGMTAARTRTRVAPPDHPIDVDPVAAAEWLAEHDQNGDDDVC